MARFIALLNPVILFFLWLFFQRLARIGPNFWVGIRIAATVRSPAAWERVHR